MALWKITVKRSPNISGLPLERKMFVEMYSPSSSDPLSSTANTRKIIKLFENKYCEDFSDRTSWVSSSYLECERIS